MKPSDVMPVFAGSEVDRLKKIIADVDIRWTTALTERNAANDRIRQLDGLLRRAQHLVPLAWPLFDEICEALEDAK